MDSSLLVPLLAGIGVALFAGPIGCFVVWRRLSYFGDTLAHAAILGVALGYLLGWYTLLSVLAVALGLSTALFIMERRLLVARDALLGLLSHSTLALGLMIFALVGAPDIHGHGGHDDHDDHDGHDDHDDHAEHAEHDEHEGHDHDAHEEHDEHAHEEHDDHAHEEHDDHASEGHEGHGHEDGLGEHSDDVVVGGHGHEYEALLFGDILNATVLDVAMIYVGGLVAMLGLLYIWRRLFASSVSPEIASSEDCSPLRMNFLFVVLLGLVVALAFKLMGALLVISLLIIPAITARSFSSSPEQMALFSSLIGLVSVILGFGLAHQIATPHGPTIVVVASALFLVSLFFMTIRNWRSRDSS